MKQVLDIITELEWSVMCYTCVLYVLYMCLICAIHVSYMWHTCTLCVLYMCHAEDGYYDLLFSKTGN